MRYQLELDVRERTWIRKGQGISKPPKENYPYLVVTDLSWSADWSKEMLLLVWQQEPQLNGDLHLLTSIQMLGKIFIGTVYI